MHIAATGSAGAANARNATMQRKLGRALPALRDVLERAGVVALFDAQVSELRVAISNRLLTSARQRRACDLLPPPASRLGRLAPKRQLKGQKPGHCSQNTVTHVPEVNLGEPSDICENLQAPKCLFEVARTPTFAFGYESGEFCEFRGEIA